MHVCIFGTGASGWMVAHSLKNLKEVTKITIIGSDQIPSIGVGESTTLLFDMWIKNNLNLSKKEFYNFIKKINAVVKYGVSYEGWSPKTFLHGFHPHHMPVNAHLLGNKPKSDNANIYNSYIASYAYENNIVLDMDYHVLSWQFEADSLIVELQNLSKKEEKITHKVSTLKSVEYENLENEKILKATLENGEEIYADYYVNSIGSTSFNQQIFKEEYEWYDNILLTNKAIFAPIEYNNKEKEIHPYTVAKTMKYGWRWITPTWNRIGTGYVFSDKHCSIEDAKKELAEDIGKNLDFQVVDFTPRKVKKTFKTNYCSIGMAAGFLEPLDAPGLTITIHNIGMLKSLIPLKTKDNYDKVLNKLNNKSDRIFNFWASFILLQYKTSHRNDTKFWKDHKNVKFDFFEDLYKDLQNLKNSNIEWTTFYNTISGKDINWDIDTKEMPQKLNTLNFVSMNHLDFLNLMRTNENFVKIIKDLNQFCLPITYK